MRFGVLTVENLDQALARAGGGKRDSGRHAAEAVLMMGALRGTWGVSNEALALGITLLIHVIGICFLFGLHAAQR